jgi:hypothetical protein
MHSCRGLFGSRQAILAPPSARSEYDGISGRLSRVMRKKWLKRLGIVLASLVGVLLGALLIAWMLLRSTPGWYPTAILSAEQRENVARSAQDKLIIVQNAADEARANEYAVSRRNAARAPSAAITLTLSDDEINALLEKWTVWPIVKAGYEKFMSDPRIVLGEGRLILAGHVAEVEAVASVHFAPRIDEQGQLRVEMVRVQAGRLPIPQALLARYQQQAVGAVNRRMFRWRQVARIDDTGVANDDAIQAVFGDLLLSVLADRPSEAVTFVPLIGGKVLAVKLLDIRIEPHKLTLTVQPMLPTEREAILSRIKSGQPLAGSN